MVREEILKVCTMFKLGQCAEKKWRRLCGFDYLVKVVTGIKFKDSVEITTVDYELASVEGGFYLLRTTGERGHFY